MPEGAPPIIPVVVIDEAEQGPGLARALLKGGIQAIEVTLRTVAAMDAIRLIARDVPEIYLGAGTVITPDDVQQVRAAGAKFMVSPGCTPRLHQAAEAARLPFLAGAATASEAMAMQELGYTHLKFFPADAHGGVSGLKGLGGPLLGLSFCPTGGVSAKNAADYLALTNCFAVGGSWVAPGDAIKSSDWKRIEDLSREAANLV
jgi:2-dehydro-3-deoxyphosphogluconate aldolase/(4S)-4-hydroxy-2-oxoglutarate aldolase